MVKKLTEGPKDKHHHHIFIDNYFTSFCYIITNHNRGELKTLQRGKVTASLWTDNNVMSTTSQPAATDTLKGWYLHLHPLPRSHHHLQAKHGWHRQRGAAPWLLQLQGEEQEILHVYLLLLARCKHYKCFHLVGGELCLYPTSKSSGYKCHLCHKHSALSAKP